MEQVIEFTHPIGKNHACKASRRGYQQAIDRLKRAERDLGETAAFIAASLTTVTAIQAVISIAKDQLELSNRVLQLAFHGYVTIFILILLLGMIRARSAMRRRSQAEREIDQTKKGIFEFCPMDQWPEPDE
jgi:cytochrome c biogenesis protein CcdA